MDETRYITASIISIGDELLIGQTVNTNASWMGEQLSLNGIRPVHIDTIADELEPILEALHRAKGDIVLITGGLGPTRDDKTKDALCGFFNTHVVRNNEVETRIRRIFDRLGRPVLEANLMQADLPEGCNILPNPRGTASGMWFEKDQRVFVSLPGVPYEMKAIMDKEVLPRLVERFDPPSIVHRTIMTTGMGESHLAERIRSWEDGLKAHGISLAYLPSPGLVKLRLSTYGDHDKEKARQVVDAQVKALYQLIPDLIYGEQHLTMEEVVGTALRMAGETLATAESCTGGYLAHRITSVPGSSDYFLGSVISYANHVKTGQLGVSVHDLKTHGAVSEPVVLQMAQGVLQQMGSDWALATSGVAGPSGGTEEKPVGLVWLGIVGPGVSRAVKMQLFGDRLQIIERTALAAMDLLRKEMARKAVPGY